MPSIQDLLSIQVGKQTVLATAVVPTAKIMGITDCKFKPINDAMVFDELRGSLAPGYNTALTKIGAAGTISMYGFFEDINYFMESLLGTIVPSGAGPYLRTAAAPISAAPAPRINTIVYGDATNCYKITGAICTKVVLKGEANKPLMATFDFIGLSMTPGTLAGLADRAQNAAMSQHAILSVDAWAGTIGTTPIATVAWDFELTVDSKRALDWYLGGLAAAAYHDKAWSGSLKLNVELQAATKAYLDEIIGGTTVHQRQVRIKYANGANLISQFDFAGTAIKAPDVFDFRDTVVGVKIEYGEGTYNSGLSNWFAYSNTTGVATLV